ncbi:hypothetical protein [Hymenobacter cavernae]|nr:hypothetical protein [Hymenobacter cavernae]
MHTKRLSCENLTHRTSGARRLASGAESQQQQEQQKAYGEKG